MALLSYETPGPPPPDFPDRRTTLRVAGTVAVMVGMGIAALGILMFVSFVLPDPGETPRPAGEVMGDVAFCAGGAAFCIWVGAGALKFRRWVRPLILAAGWTWLAATALFLIAFAAPLLETIQALRAANTGGQSGAAFAGGMAITSCFVLFVYTLLPALAVALFHRRGVRETLAYYDREPRWTDGRPVPVLALSLSLAVLAAATAAAAPARPVFPLFGAVLVGPPAVAGCLVVALILAWLASATFRLRRAGWWATLSILVLYLVSRVVTERVGDLAGAAERAGYTPEQLGEGSYGLGRGTARVWFVLFWGGSLCYLLYLRRFFAPPAPGHAAGPLPAVAAPPPAQSPPAP